MNYPAEARFQNGGVRIVSQDPVTVVLKDVANSIGYTASNLKRAIKNKYQGLHEVKTPGVTQEMITVTRPGLSQALATLRPQDPEKRRKVDAFQDWLYEEVLESIYDTGSYHMGDGAPVEESGDMLEVAETLIQSLKEARTERYEIQRHQEHTEYEVEQLEERVEHLEASKKSMLQQTHTRYGHDAQGYTWDGMRRQINNLVGREQERTRQRFNRVYRRLYDATEREFGFHALKLKEWRNASSGLKALDFDEMRAVYAVARWLFQ